MTGRAAVREALGLASLAASAPPQDVTPADPPPRLAAAVPAPPIVPDPFGYRVDDPKIVRIRRPATGFKNAWAILPRLTFYERDTEIREPVRTFTLDSAPEKPVDALSGDHVWALGTSRADQRGEYVETLGNGWPLDPWQVSENSNADQAAYLRLLGNFVE